MLVNEISRMLQTVNQATFVGLNYTNQNGENANYVIIADADFKVAVKKSIDALRNLTDADFTAIAEMYGVNNVGGIQYSNNAKGREYLLSGKLPKEGTKAREDVLNSIKVTKTLFEIRTDMIEGLLNNLNSDTASEQSIAQRETYEYICNSVKRHKETGEIYVFGKAHTKQVLIEGIYPQSTQLPETMQKNAISRYCKHIGKELPHERFRTFKVTENQLRRLRVNGEMVEVID